MLLFLLAGAFLSCGCNSAPDRAASQEASRKDAVRGYMQRMVGPGAEAKTYLSLYTTHKVECESEEPGLVRRSSCTQAKVDLAHIERSWRQALAIAQEMAQDAALSDKDRKQAEELAKAIGTGIERIRRAKPGKLPQL